MAYKAGYCNHSLALTLKICKFSLFESGGTQDLILQQNLEAYISKLQTSPEFESTTAQLAPCLAKFRLVIVHKKFESGSVRKLFVFPLNDEFFDS